MPSIGLISKARLLGFFLNSSITNAGTIELRTGTCTTRPARGCVYCSGTLYQSGSGSPFKSLTRINMILVYNKGVILVVCFLYGFCAPAFGSQGEVREVSIETTVGVINPSSCLVYCDKAYVTL